MYARTQISFDPDLPLAPGLYRVSRPKAGGMVTHVGILEVGCAQYLGSPPSATVAHLGPTGLRVDQFDRADGWTIGEALPNQVHAVRRLRSAIDPTYDALFNNCEHFVEYVATGTKQSGQLKAVGIVAATIVGLAFVLKQ